MVARNDGGTGAGEQGTAAGDQGSNMREHTEQLRQQMMDKAARAVDQVRHNAESAVSDQKVRAAEGVNSIAGALREAGKKLHDQQDEYVAPYADQAAESLEQFAGYLRDRDVWGLVDDVRDLARRRPEWFIGGAFVLGLVAARFLKSSAGGASASKLPARMEDVSGDRFSGGDGSGGLYGGASMAGAAGSAGSGLGGLGGNTGAFGSTGAGTSASTGGMASTAGPSCGPGPGAPGSPGTPGSPGSPASAV